MIKKNKIKIPSRYVAEGENFFSSTVDFTAEGIEILYFRWKDFQKYFFEQEKETARRRHYQSHYQTIEEIQPRRHHSLEDYYVGYFIEDYGTFTSRPNYLDIAAIAEAFKVFCPKEFPKSHFVYRSCLTIGDYVQEGVSKRIKANGDDKLYTPEKLEEIYNLFLGRMIHAGFLIFHVPEPSTKERAKTLAEIIARNSIKYYKVVGRDGQIKDKYLIIDKE